MYNKAVPTLSSPHKKYLEICCLMTIFITCYLLVSVMFWPLFLHTHTGWKLSRHIQTAEVSVTNQWCSHSSAVKHSDYPTAGAKGLSTIWRWMKYSTAIIILFFLVRSCSSSSILWFQNVLFCVSVFYQYHILIFYPLFSHSYSLSCVPLESSAVAANDCCHLSKQLEVQCSSCQNEAGICSMELDDFSTLQLQTFASRSHVSRQSLLGQAAFRVSLLCPIREYLTDLKDVQNVKLCS